MIESSTDFQHLLTIEYDNKQKSIVLNNEVYSIGRHSSNTIVIHDPTISRYHCTILPVKYKENKDKKVFWIIDGDLKGNRSANGLYVNGNKCLSHELKSGDAIYIGGQKVFASYSLVDSSGYDDDDKTQPLTIEQKEAPFLTDKTQKTLTFEENSLDSSSPTEFKKERLSLIKEMLDQIYDEKDDLCYGILETDLEGKVIHTNIFFDRYFPNLKDNIQENPFLTDLLEEVEKQEDNIVVRQITYNNDRYTQSAYLNGDRQVIVSYIFEFKNKNYIEEALRESEEKYRAVVRQISEGIILVDPMTKDILEANNAYCSLTGHSSQEILSLKLYDLVAVDGEIIDSIIDKIHQNRLDLVQESLHRCQDGSLIPVEVNISIIYYSAKEVICYAVRDITERKISEEMLRYQASHDLLTKLGNRNFFNEQLYKAIANARTYEHKMAILFIDLDRFKNINDTLGHQIGDQFLQNVAKRLQKSLRNLDTIARWGGDEFTILLSEINNSNEATRVAERILHSLRQPFQILEFQLYASLSIGISIYPQDGDNPDTLLKNADIALYRAKELGGHGYQFYQPSMNQRNTELLQIESYLYNALHNNEFELYYQPQINIISKTIIGMEALIRWNHPQLGRVAPNNFIPIAEQTGLICPIGEWVIEEACQQNQIWHDLGYTDLKIAVNISARQFQQKNLVYTIANILKKTNLSPKFLEAEITESSIIQNPDLAKKILDQLSNLGVLVAMDDFGTGYSSLGYLKKFPFGKIKIDQSFVRELKNKKEDLAIISAVVTLGKGMNLQVVAEGIENDEQLKLLVDLNCRQMQGYYFSKPMNAKDATSFLQKGIDY
ncbi:diguanylate cyclase/phosphodiesterase with PAS/PAC sensor(s) [Cyanobacterium stanieri PCC 7202]|uniref:Diguanylate cyclase/phosphodiesterase with PAS/PAC sensor(S) n=1 Tax=Cyanobacterium stanieri (strain ATCC 29140 / PCC 7202) TaxID=292563 RepID=K9YJV3_CYASC|nr:diguanylate cyclase/phosphodiesterase with PAS/PAC sensor(s) [Cyanobacterium stanieri PCC 7202]